MKNWLQDISVVITGASSGIGKELTKILINKFNCKVIGVARNVKNLQQLKEEIEKDFKKGENFIPLSLDVSKEESWKEILIFSKQNNVKLIFNNAGIMLPFIKTSNLKEEDVENIFKTNFYSIYYCFKYFNNYFEKLNKDCGIVNITSSSSFCLIPGQSVYSASKCAATKISLITASEEKGKFFIGTYLPGFTSTNIFNASNLQNEQNKKEMETIVKKLSLSPTIVASKIIKFTKRKKRYKIIGRDSKALKLLNALLKEKSGDFLLGIFKKSKKQIFKDII